VTLTFANDRRILRDASGRLATVGADDLGMRSQEALRELGFAVKEPETEIAQTIRPVIHEKTLAELEENVWDTLTAWVNVIAWNDAPKTKRVRMTEYV
jgi:hypothetical protein